MSTRPLLTPEQLVSNQAISGSSTVLFPVTIKPQLSKVCYSMSWTTGMKGQFLVQVSDDYKLNADGSVKSLGTWNTLPVSSIVAATGSAAGNGFYEIATGAYAIQLTYVPDAITPGSGTVLTVFVNGQVQ